MRYNRYSDKHLILQADCLSKWQHENRTEAQVDNSSQPTVMSANNMVDCIVEYDITGGKNSL